MTELQVLLNGTALAPNYMLEQETEKTYDMIVHIRIYSDYAERMAVEDQINQLAFTYHIE